jgi:hypothetical protein
MKKEQRGRGGERERERRETYLSLHSKAVLRVDVCFNFAM